MRSVPVNRGNGFRQRGSLRQNAQKKTKDKKDKSITTPLFRAIPRDNKIHAMQYDVDFCLIFRIFEHKKAHWPS
jgi:hypothetical protein